MHEILKPLFDSLKDLPIKLIPKAILNDEYCFEERKK